MKWKYIEEFPTTFQNPTDVVSHNNIISIEDRASIDFSSHWTAGISIVSSVSPPYRVCYWTFLFLSLSLFNSLIVVSSMDIPSSSWHAKAIVRIAGGVHINVIKKGITELHATLRGPSTSYPLGELVYLLSQIRVGAWVRKISRRWWKSSRSKTNLWGFRSFNKHINWETWKCTHLGIQSHLFQSIVGYSWLNGVSDNYLNVE